MKKSLKKALIVGSVFAAAMNFNACAYGPPGMVEAPQADSNSALESSVQNDTENTTVDENTKNQ